MSIKSYNEMLQYSTFEERFKYLKLNSQVGLETFGTGRYINQKFYQSSEWRRIRNEVIVRDGGCDLGIKDRPIRGQIYIHHIEPITIESLVNGESSILDPNNLVCVSLATHNALHYGDNSILEANQIVERTPNDTCPWKK